MTRLSVNVNKLATLRNARGKNNPDLLATTLKIVSFGAQGITIHPRPDGRHIRRNDAFDLAKSLSVEFNIEGYPDEGYLDLVAEIKPAQCTLVPDPPHVLTSNAGWDVKQHHQLLKNTVSFLQDKGIRTSLFIDPNNFSAEDYEYLKQTGTDRVELYTEQYAIDFDTPNAEKTIAVYKHVGKTILEMGIGLNAGHDLDCNNLPTLIKVLPEIEEVSIGHALICDSLEYGMKETIRRYLDCLR